MIKYLAILLCFIAASCHAQNAITGIFSPNLESDWLILYKIEGTKQVFINNTTIKKDSIVIGGEKQAVGKFTIQLPASAKPGTYRATYRLEGAGYIDFFYNKEEVSFILNPAYPNQSISFSKSTENKLYKSYLDAISLAQEKLDSIQIAVLQDSTLNLQKDYKLAYANIDSLQKKYELASQNKLIAPVIKASARSNPKEMLTTVDAYIANMKNTFFDKIDFSNQVLINSSFITNRILDFVFYVNYSDDQEIQQKRFKNAIKIVLSKIQNNAYKRDIIEFLITQFEESKNLEIIDFLFEKHYKKLPLTWQNQQFISDKEALFAAEIGRIAPDFSWTENGKNMQLSTLQDATSYVLVFWSTTCSHCLREIPQLHSYMKDKKNTKVVAFALENDAFVWENYTKTNLFGWHNILGLKKWKNKIARTYQIHATPSYFVLDKNKKIIAKPSEISDVKDFFEKK